MSWIVLASLTGGRRNAASGGAFRLWTRAAVTANVLTLGALEVPAFDSQPG